MLETKEKLTLGLVFVVVFFFVVLRPFESRDNEIGESISFDAIGSLWRTIADSFGSKHKEQTISITQNNKATNNVVVASDKKFVAVDVMYATDRKRNSTNMLGEIYGPERGDVKYGVANVSIPFNHKMGELEEPRFYKLEVRNDPEKHVVLVGLKELEMREFYSRIKTNGEQSANKSAFIFIHGYNVKFEDAARRTAQISYDIGFRGTPVFYSWPSAGEVKKYTIDENNVDWSTKNIEGFLDDFAEKSNVERIYLIGHSMGTRALTKAYASLISKRPELKKRFVEIILAAPDIDAEIFKRDIAPAILAGEGKVTLYANSDDIPLQASKTVHGSPRAGDSGNGIVVVKGMESIDSTGMGTDFLSHSYPLQNRSILADMDLIFKNGLRANDRPGLEMLPVKKSQLHYWKFKQ